MEESGGISMFMGEYHHNLDEKGRIVLPSKFREELGSSIVLTRGIEKCLYVYSEKDFAKLTEKLNHLSFTKKNTRAFIRIFFSKATLTELDRQGRAIITNPQKIYANLKKECVIIGANNRVEIWDKDAWCEELLKTEEQLESISENLELGDDL